MKRRFFIQTLLCSVNFISFPTLSKVSAIREVNTVSDLLTLIPSYEGEYVKVLSYSQNNILGGGYFVAKRIESKTDFGVIFNTSSGLSWYRLDAKKRLLEPEWYGCTGDGVTDDSVAFNHLLSALSDGDTIIMRKDASYYNSLPTKKSRFIISRNNIKIIGNGARIFRRSTSIETKKNDVGNLATLKITGNNFKIIGNLTISGGEGDAPLMNRFNFSVSKEKYVRGFSSSHALFIENVDGLYLSPELKCNNAIFPLYVYKSKNLEIYGEYSNSGQVYPVRDKDLQLGSCVKIARSKLFKININTSHSAYCGLEIEPYCDSGDVTVNASDCYMHGCIVHQFSNNIKVNVNFSGSSEGAGIRVSSGSQNIFGNVTAFNCVNAVLIVSKGSSICKNINLKVKCQNLKGDALLIYNDDKVNPSLIQGRFTILKADNKTRLINISNCNAVDILLDKSIYSSLSLDKQSIVKCIGTEVMML